jgi:hypothetical protein
MNRLFRSRVEAVYHLAVHPETGEPWPGVRGRPPRAGSGMSIGRDREQPLPETFVELVDTLVAGSRSSRH